MEIEEEYLVFEEGGLIPSHPNKSTAGEIISYHTQRAGFGHQEPTEISQD